MHVCSAASLSQHVVHSMATFSSSVEPLGRLVCIWMERHLLKPARILWTIRTLWTTPPVSGHTLQARLMLTDSVIDSDIISHPLHDVVMWTGIIISGDWSLLALVTPVASSIRKVGGRAGSCSYLAQRHRILTEQMWVLKIFKFAKMEDLSPRFCFFHENFEKKILWLPEIWGVTIALCHSANGVHIIYLLATDRHFMAADLHVYMSMQTRTCQTSHTLWNFLWIFLKSTNLSLCFVKKLRNCFTVCIIWTDFYCAFHNLITQFFNVTICEAVSLLVLCNLSMFFQVTYLIVF